MSMYLNFGYLEVAFQSLINKSNQLMSKLSIKSINKPVKVSIACLPRQVRFILTTVNYHL